MEVNPAFRYASAAAFSADIHRYEENSPIEARKVGRWTVAFKFVRRHQVATALSAALVMALLLGSVGVGWEALHGQHEARMAQQAAQRAESEARREKATRDFLVNIFRVNDPRVASAKPKGAITAKELMDLSYARIEKDLANDPEVEIELLGAMAEIYGLLDESERALQLGRRRVNLLRATGRDVSGDIIEELISQADLASSLSRYSDAEMLLQQADQAIVAAGLERSAHRALWWYEAATVSMADASKERSRVDDLEKSIALYRAVAPHDPHLGYAYADLGGV